MLPRSSIADSRFTTTRLAAMRRAPCASVTDMTIGSNSGVRPTARATANMNDSSQGRPSNALASSANSTSSSVMRMIRKPKRRTPTSKEVGGGVVSSSPAIAPIAEVSPVRATSRRAEPEITEVPMNAGARRIGEVLGLRRVARALLDRVGLAGQKRLAHEKIARFEHARIGRNQVAGGDQQHVPGDDQGDVDFTLDALADHACAHRDRLPQRRGGARGAALLHEIERDREQHQQQHDDEARRLARGGRHGACGEQYQHQRIAEARQEFQQQRPRAVLAEGIAAVALDPLPGLRVGEASAVGVEFALQFRQRAAPPGIGDAGRCAHEVSAPTGGGTG